MSEDAFFDPVARGLATGAAASALAMEFFGQSLVEIPSALGWPASHPIPIARMRGAGGVVYVPAIRRTDFIPASIFASTAYHLDTAGSDSNDGLTSGTPFASLKKAFETGNASGAASYQVILAPGTYTYTKGPQQVAPTKPISMRCSGPGRAIVSAHKVQTWVYHSGTVNTDAVYKVVNPSEVPLRVFDLYAGDDAHDTYPELTKQSSVANVQANANTWFYDTSGTPTLYARLTSGAAITDTRARVYTSLNNFNSDATGALGVPAFAADGCHIHLKGIDFEGGRYGLPMIGGTRNLFAEDCSWRYAGGTGFDYDGITVDQMNGFAIFVNCWADKNTKDGINLHANGGTSLYTLTYNCSGYYNGAFGSTSDNGLTGHESVVSIDIGGNYSECNGGLVHYVGTSKVLCLGTRGTGSREATTSPAFKTSDTAQMWMEECYASGGTQAIYAQGGTIYERRTTLAAGSRARTTGTLTKW